MVEDLVAVLALADGLRPGTFSSGYKLHSKR